MSPIDLRYTNEVSETLSKNEISKINSWKTTSAFRAFRFSTAPVRQAVVVLLMSFGVCSLLDTHRVSAAVVVDASSAKSASPGNIAWHSCEGILQTSIARRCKSRWIGINRTGRRSHWP
jgi:hypothetical protein